MPSWEADSQDFISDLARRPAARSPATIGEVWSTEWNRSGLDTLSGVGAPMRKAYDELESAVTAAAGKPAQDLAREAGFATFSEAQPLSERAAMLRQAVTRLPADARDRLEPLLDVRRRAAESAQKTERDAAELEAVTYGLSGVATSWAAGIARQAVDPVNVFTLPLGGPLKGAVLPMLLREAGIGALTQAAQEPFIQPGRAELGLEAGFGHGAANVAQAAVGAAGMAGLFRVGAWGIRRLRGVSPEVGIRTADAPDAVTGDRPSLDIGGVRNNAPTESVALRAVEPDDLTAAAHLVERDQMIDHVAPVRTPEGVAAHAEGVDAAGRAIETGGSIEAVAPVPQIRLERAGGSKYNILDADGNVVVTADIGIVEVGGRKLAQIEDINTPALEKVKTQEEHDAVVAASRNVLGTAQMREAMRQFLELHPDVEGFTGNRVSGARNAGRMSPDNIQNVVVPVRLEDVPVPERMRAAERPLPTPPPQAGEGAATAAAPKPLGDPVLAKEFDRVLAEAGDFEIHIDGQKLKASDAMKIAENENAAARELTECIGAST